MVRIHDRAARPTGAVKSAAAIATEIMILLNIDLRIPQVRPRVEGKRSAPSGLTRVLAVLGLSDHVSDYEYEMFRSLLATGLWSIAKAFEVAINMLVVIMESSENHLKRREV